VCHDAPRSAALTVDTVALGADAAGCMRPRGAVTIGGDAAGTVVVVAVVVVVVVDVVEEVGAETVVDVVVDVTVSGFADELHAALTSSSAAHKLLRPRHRCTAS
jgi:predicted dinucleotide-binding enzyme